MRKHKLFLLLAALMLPTALHAQTFFPLVLDFEDEYVNAEWTYAQGSTNRWVVGAAAVGGGDSAIYISSDGGATRGYNNTTTAVSYAAYPFQVDEAGQYAVSFDWLCTGEAGYSVYDFLAVCVAPAGATLSADAFPGGASSWPTTMPAGWVLLTGDRLHSQSTWQTATDNLTLDTGRYQLVLMWRNDGSSGSDPAAVDNIVVAQLTCPQPSALVLDTVDAENIGFHWGAGGTESEWVVAVNGEDYGSTFDTTFFVSGLNANTEYSFSVRAFCGYDDTSFATVATWRTACGVLTQDMLPLVENFEGYTAGSGVLPSCYSRLNYASSYTAYPYLYNYSYYANSGSQMMYFYANGLHADSYLVLPEMDGVDGLKVRFAFRASSASATMTLGTMTDPTDSSTFVPVHTFAHSGNSQYLECEATVSAADTVRYLALRASSSSTYTSMYLDDLTVSVASGCERPSAVAVSAITNEGATVHWTDTLQQGNYAVEYWSAADSSDMQTVSVSDTAAALTDLVPNTLYIVNVYTDCGDYSEARSTTFRTLCNTVAETDMPWSESFDSLPSGEAPLCWTTLAGNITVRSSSSTAHSGSQYLDFRGAVGNTILMPQFEADLSGYTLTFWTRPESDNSSCGSFSVGYIANDDATATFVPFATWSYTDFVDGGSVAWTEKEVSLASIPSDARLAFRQSGNSTYYYWYVDDVTLAASNACARPVSATVVSVGGTTATISWADTAATGAYSVSYWSAADSSDLQTVSVADTIVTLTALTPQSDYTVEVRSVCGSDLSEARTASFTTLCLEVATADLPWTEDFESMTAGSLDACWDRSYISSYGSYYTYSSTSHSSYARVGSDAAHGGSQSLVLSSYNYSEYDDYDYDYYYYEARSLGYLPLFESAVQGLGLSFWYRVDTVGASLAVGVSTTVADTTDFVRLETFVPADTAWHLYSVELGAYAGTGRRITFMQYNDTEADEDNTVAGYIDDITVSAASSCTRPTQVTVSAVSVTGATVAWHELNTVGTYKVKWTANDSTIVTGDTVAVISGLMPNTDYTVEVSRLCGSDYTAARTASFHTLCTAIADLPWSEGFDALSGTMSDGFSADCWTVLNPYISYYSYPYLSTSGYNSAKSLYLSGSSTTAPVVALPSFADSLSTLTLTFWARSTATDPVVEVGVLGDIADAASFTTVQTVSLSNVWADYEVNFPAGSMGNIAFRYAQKTCYIDSITVGQRMACSRPASVSMTFVGVDSASVAIADPDAVLHYRLWLSHDSTVDSVDITTASHLFTGLAANTPYSVSVATLCADGTVTGTVSTQFRTGCAAMTLPYTEDFEGYASYDMPDCWSTPNTNSSSSRNVLYVYNYTANSGSRCLRFNYSEPAGNIAVLPVMDGATGSLMMTFAHRPESASSYCGTFYVGYMTNPADAATFVAVDTIAATDFASAAYRTESVTFAGAPADARIAFKHVSTTNNWYWHIDDLTVMVAPSCQGPQAIAVSALTTTTATITVTDSLGGTYRLVCTDGTTADTVSFTGASYTITGLAEGTNYSVSLSTACTDGTFTVPVTAVFKTPCTDLTHAADLPFVETFDSLPTSQALDGCWNTLSYYNSSTVYPYVYSSTRHGNSGNSLYFYLYSNNQPEYLVLPAFDSVGDLQVRFWLYCAYTQPNITVGVMTNASDTTTFVPVATVNSVGGSRWTEYAVSLRGYTGSGKHIALRGGVSSGSYYSLYLDDLTVELAPSCERPQAVAVDTVGLDMVTLAITDANAVGSYTVVYTDGITTDSVVSTSTTVTINGLQHSTDYTFRVVANCPDGLQTFYIEGAFSTLCGIVSHADLPWTEDFNAYTSGASLNHCWDVFNTSTTSYGYPSSSYNHSGTGNSLYFYNGYNNYYQLVSLPEFDSIGDLMITFWSHSSSSSDTTAGFIVGAMGTPGVESTFVPVDTVYCNLPGATWQQHEVRFTGYTGTAHHIALKNIGTSTYVGLYVDDITVMVAPSCSSPQAVVVNNISTTTADVTINDPDYTGDYVIVVGSAAGSDTISTFLTNVTLTGLTPATNYTVSVYSVCSDGNLTMPASTAFTTECGPIASLPWSEDFESYAGGTGTMPVCWMPYYMRSDSTVATNTGNRVYVNASNGNPGRALEMYSYSNYGSASTNDAGQTFAVAVLPEFDAPLASLAVSFDLRFTKSTAAMERFEVGVVTDAEDPMTFIPVDTIMSTGSTAYSNYSVALASYNGTGRIAFRYTYLYNNDYYWCFVDNITVDGSSACAAPSIDAVAVTDGSATVSYTTDADSIAVAFAEAAVWNPATATGTTVAATGTYTFTGLADATEYVVAVRSVCADGSMSVWATRRVVTDSLNCQAVADITVTDITYDGATFSWTPAGSESAWQVKVYNTRDSVITTVTTPSYTISGLYQDMTYNVTVRPLCGAAANIEGPWCDNATFTTLNCRPVTDVQASQVTTTSAAISWTASSTGIDKWDIVYGIYGGASTTVTVTSNPYVITGLEPETEYEVYVYSYCSDNIRSGNAAMATFVTSVGIDDVDGSSFVSIYPNPASTTVTISGINGAANVEFVDMNGRVCGTWRVDDGMVDIDVTSLSQGAYFVRITGERVNAIRKLIVR